MTSRQSNGYANTCTIYKYTVQIQVIQQSPTLFKLEFSALFVMNVQVNCAMKLFSIPERRGTRGDGMKKDSIALISLDIII